MTDTERIDWLQSIVIEQSNAPKSDLPAWYKIGFAGMRALDLRAAIDAAIPKPPPHDYTSTACQHKLHGDCRKTCKFCGVACACTCHTLGADS